MRCTLNPRSTGAVCTGKTNIASTNLVIVGKGPAIQSQRIKHKFLEGIMFWTCLIYDIDIFSLQYIQLGSLVDKKATIIITRKMLD